jgi:hypothetical protein
LKAELENEEKNETKQDEKNHNNFNINNNSNTNGREGGNEGGEDVESSINNKPSSQQPGGVKKAKRAVLQLFIRAVAPQQSNLALVDQAITDRIMSYLLMNCQSVTESLKIFFFSIFLFSLSLFAPKSANSFYYHSIKIHQKCYFQSDYNKKLHSSEKNLKSSDFSS